MQPRLSVVTLGVEDLPRARRFYEALGWRVSPASNEHVAFIDLNGVVLSLFGRAALAEDAKVSAEGNGFRGFSLAHNVASKQEVDAVLAHAEGAGATIVNPAHDAFWGGYSGYFRDPEGFLWEVAWNPFWPLGEDGRVQLPRD